MELPHQQVNSRFPAGLMWGNIAFEIVRVNGFFRQTIALFQRGSARPSTYSASARTSRPKTLFSVQAIADELNEFRQQNGIPPLTLEAHLTGPLNDWLQRVAQDGSRRRRRGYSTIEAGCTQICCSDSVTAVATNSHRTHERYPHRPTSSKKSEREPCRRWFQTIFQSARC